MNGSPASPPDNPLEERNAQTILIVLLEGGEQKKTTLMRQVSKSSSMQSRMDSLESSGLIETRTDSFSYNTKWVGLTEKGRNVAILLKQIHEIMKNRKEKAAQARSPCLV